MATMTAVEKDDFAHALGQTMEFFGKKLEKHQFGFWYQAFSEYDLSEIKRALLEYTKSGRYAPKPIDILELMSVSRSPIHTAMRFPNTAIAVDTAEVEIVCVTIWVGYPQRVLGAAWPILDSLNRYSPVVVLSPRKYVQSSC